MKSNKASYPAAILKSLADETVARARDDFPEAGTVYTDGSLNPDTGWAGLVSICRRKRLANI